MRFLTILFLMVLPVSALAKNDPVPLRLQYKDAAISALTGIDLRMRKGEFTALLGPNGGGKTTVIHGVGRISEPTGGTISVTIYDLLRREFGEVTVTGGIDFSTMPTGRMAPGPEGLYISLGGEIPIWVSAVESGRMAEIAMLVSIMKKIDKVLGERRPEATKRGIFAYEAFVAQDRNIDPAIFDLPDKEGLKKIELATGGATGVQVTKKKSVKKKIPAVAATAGESAMTGAVTGDAAASGSGN